MDDLRKLEPAGLLAAYATTQEDLSNAVKLLKLQLGTVHASLDRKKRSATGSSSTKYHLSPNETGSEDQDSKEVFTISLFAVSLLQVRVHYPPISPYIYES